MGIRSDAHFGVEERDRVSVIRELQQALEEFDAAQYGVAQVRVVGSDGNSFVIQLTMVSADAEKADADADRATEAIKGIIRRRFELGAVRERQRELTLA